MSPRTTNRLLLAAAAVLFSTGGAAIKATHLTNWQVASFRSGVAAAVLLALLPGARRNWRPSVAAVAVAYAATLVLFVTANKLTTSANAIYLQSTAPLYVLLLSPWLLKERARVSDLVLAGLVGFGLCLFFVGREPSVYTAPDPLRGNLFAAASGLTWAFTVMGLRKVEGFAGAGAALSTVAVGNLLAFAGCLPMALPVTHLEWGDAAVLVYLGVFQIGLAYVCVTRALAEVPAFEASILLLIEPALNPVWTWIVHGERPGVWALAGGALILGASLAHTWWESRR
jgi:drug/metabolite transporter, DME family